jgi:hypothetical protein
LLNIFFMTLKNIKFSLFLCFALMVGLAGQSQAQHKYKGGGMTGYGFFGNLKHKMKHNALLKGHDSGAGLSSYYASFGTTTYYGDLCDRYDCMVFRPNFGIGYAYRWDRNLSVRAEVNYYRLYSNDYYAYRNFSFRSGNVEAYVAAVYDIFPFHQRFKKRKRITPYVFGGIGLTYFNPHAKYQGKWVALEPLHTEGHGYSRVTGMIPFGFGGKIKSGKGFDYYLEAGYRKTFSDHIDDVSSHNFQPIGSFSDPTAAALSNRTGEPDAVVHNPDGKVGDNYKGYRGNPHKKDGYFIFQVKVVYTPQLKYLSVPRYRHKVGTRTH